MKPKLAFFKALIIVFSAASLSSIAALRPIKLLGEPVPPGTTPARTVVIKPNTKHFHVVSGETVKFVIGDKEFMWHFDGPEGPFDLAQIVPSGTLSRKVSG